MKIAYFFMGVLDFVFAILFLLKFDQSKNILPLIMAFILSFIGGIFIAHSSTKR